MFLRSMFFFFCLLSSFWNIYVYFTAILCCVYVCVFIWGLGVSSRIKRFMLGFALLRPINNQRPFKRGNKHINGGASIELFILTQLNTQFESDFTIEGILIEMTSFCVGQVGVKIVHLSRSIFSWLSRTTKKNWNTISGQYIFY